MKKYLIIAITSVVGHLSASGQQGSNQAQTGIIISPITNATGETQINGIPYSQYKAQQEAIKRAKEAAAAKVIAEQQKQAENKNNSHQNDHANPALIKQAEPVGATKQIQDAKGISRQVEVKQADKAGNASDIPKKSN